MKWYYVVGFLIAVVVVNGIRMNVWDACGFESEYEAHLFNSLLCFLGI